ncbi:MAG: mandelate racemase, partial [Rhizobacter sp.]|nr:mandelate racemase [Rhizobacter sp.]
RCTLWNQAPGAAFFMSAEDLTTQPGLSVQQDLALIDLLGITHVERNAHHFIDGFAERPQAEAQAYLQAHPDLYHLQNGRVRLRIEHGRLAMGSLQASGYASSVLPMLDDTPAMPSADWPPRPER